MRTVEEADLVLAGDATTDGQASAVPAVVAGLLGLPQLTHARELDVDGGRARAERETDSGEATLEASPPVTDTRAGSRETGVNVLAAMPTGVPESSAHRAVTPGGKQPNAWRSTAGSVGVATSGLLR